ncbi:MAG: hypothetical protein ACRC57_12650 [Sarcina sp.]
MKKGLIIGSFILGTLGASSAIYFGDKKQNVKSKIKNKLGLKDKKLIECATLEL